MREGSNCEPVECQLFQMLKLCEKAPTPIFTRSHNLRRKFKLSLKLLNSKKNILDSQNSDIPNSGTYPYSDIFLPHENVTILKT